MKFKLNFVLVLLFLVSLINLIQTQSSDFGNLACSFGAGPSNTCKWKGEGFRTHINNVGIHDIGFNGADTAPAPGEGHIEAYITDASHDPVILTVNGVLTSPELKPKSSMDCFSFYYYIHGEGVGYFNLNLTSDGKQQIIWTRRDSAGDMWHLNKINVEPQNSTYILEFDVMSGAGAIALGKFQTSPGACSADSLCDFESGNCGFTVTATNPDYKFKLIEASGAEWRVSGQNYDHTTSSEKGHIMEASKGNNGDETSLISPLFPGFNAKYCLQFWYWRHISEVNRIDVLDQDNSTLWTSNYTFPTVMWHRAKVDVDMHKVKQFIIRATHLANKTSPVDIDDISLTPGTCPPVLDCDFNKDLCGWIRNVNQNEWWWDHGIGRVERPQYLPNDFKYTFADPSAPKDGMYLYTDFTELRYKLAVMKIMSEYLPSSYKACLTFFYLPRSFNTTRNQFSIYLVDSNGKNIKTVYVLNSIPITKKWLKQSINIVSDQTYRIVMQTNTTVPSTYLAIDDISHVPGQCDQTHVTTAPTTPSPDLPIDSLSCDFEKDNLCSWTNSQSNQKWKTIRPSDIAVPTFLPSADSNRNSNGLYAYYEDFNGPSNASITITNNEVKGGVSTPFCLSLWYYIRTSGYCQLNITVRGIDNSLNNVLIRDEETSYNWRHLQLEAPGDKNGYVYTINALVKQGSVAVDNIVVKHQPCQQTDLDVFRCTFENGHNCSFSPTYNPNSFYLIWELYRGNDTHIRANDHTLKSELGHFYALDFYQLEKYHAATSFPQKMISGYFKPSPQICVTFSYYMTGLIKNEALNFYFQNEQASSPAANWTVAGDLGPFWYTHQITYSSDLKWRIAFDVKRFGSYYGLIAIDDVNVDLGNSCPKKGFCDFERKDTCMWESVPPTRAVSVGINQTTKQEWANTPLNTLISNTNILKYTDFEWVVLSPDSVATDAYPQTDHTIGKKSGNYLLLKSETPRLVGDRAVLVSDHYDIGADRSFCFKLYYFFKNGGSHGTSKFEIYQAENNNHYKKLAEVTQSNTSREWSQINITAKAMNPSSKNMWFYLVGDVGTLNSSIAIDDISITLGDCNDPNFFICKPSQKRILRKFVCDGIKDCDNGADEADCGTCAFKNKDLCGFQICCGSQENKQYNFRFGEYQVGPRGGPKGQPNYMLATSFEDSDYMDSTDLTTPYIHGTASGCTVNFDYIMFGVLPNQNTLVNKKPFKWSHLFISIVREGSESTQIWNSDAFQPLSETWVKGQAIVGRVYGRIQLSYRAEDGSPHGTEGYVGLANINMTDCYQGTSIQCSDKSLYLCSNGRCVSRMFVCDYVDDCGDGSDESRSMCRNKNSYKLNCDFENNFCFWGQYRKDRWNISQGYKSLTDGPTRDHTKGIRTGSYLLLRSDSKVNTSSVIMGPTLDPSSDCYMRFWLTMEGNSSLMGSLTIAGEDLVTGHPTTFWKSDKSMFPAHLFGFTRQIVKLSPITTTFRLFIKGELSAHGNSSLSSYIAIDDISFDEKCTQARSTLAPGQSSTTPTKILTTPIPCGSTIKFMCKTSGKCIDRTKVCDFHKDCEDGSDELDCGRCNFERIDDHGNPSMCGWYDSGYGKGHWVVTTAKDLNKINKLLPSVDAHGNSSGKYLIIDTSKGGTENYPARLLSPVFGATSTTCRMTFYYRHDYGQSGSRLTINLYRRNIRITRRPLLTITDTTTWKQYSVSLGGLPVHSRFEIQADSAPDSRTQPYIDMALDEINFVDCEPKATPATPSDLNCDFEGGQCGWYDWHMAMFSKIAWVRTNSRQIRPGHDHTGRKQPLPSKYGYWIYTQRNPSMTGNDSATLMSSTRLAPTTASKCLTFWYHMFGRDPANFTVLLNTVNSPTQAHPKILWIKRQPQSNNWIMAQVNVPAQVYSFYLMFKADLIAKSQDNIGLDDITFSEGNCPSTPDCDFEIDSCNWFYTPGDFVRTSPDSLNTTNPPIDHTLSAPDGHYLKVNALKQWTKLYYKVPVHSNDSILPGQTFPSSLMCLKLWYYMGSGGTPLTIDDAFNISTSRQNGLKGTDANALRLSNDLNRWQYWRQTINVSPNDMVYINGHISGSDSTLAFDDIQITKQPCEQPGWCDFENDFCGWSNIALAKTRQVLWTRNSGETGSFNSGPKKDHTLGTEEGWYVTVPLDAQFNGTATLQSERLGPFPSAVCFTFFYHILLSDSSVMSPKLTVLFVSPFLESPRVLANLSSSNFDGWNQFAQTIVGLPSGKFQLRTLEGQTSRADVAVDDISLKSGSCDQTLSNRTTPHPMTRHPMGSTHGSNVSDQKPLTKGTTLGTTVTPKVTSGDLKHKSKSDDNKSKAGKIAAGVLVPLFLIGAILGFLYFLRYKKRMQEEDRVGPLPHQNQSTEMVETKFEQVNLNQ